MKRLADIAGRVRLLGRSTPVNFAAEVARLSAAWGEGRAEAPRFEYGLPPDLSAERRELAAFAAALRAAARGEPLAELYAERADELAIEAAACEAAGTAAFWELCRRRYRRRDACDDEADVLAPEWAAAAPSADEPAAVRSDDEADPRSLLSAMRRAVGEHRLPFRVTVAKALAPLAATGDGVILVAAGRHPTAVDTARTVLHEVVGHALPTARARRSGVPLLAIGTAFGSDDQEGRALLEEERAAFLTPHRRRELGLRHLAARAVEGRAGFIDTARMLLARGATAAEAVRIAARAHRGGGLAREAVYMPAFLRVRAALARDPSLGDVLGSGRVSVSAAHLLRRAALARGGSALGERGLAASRSK